MLRSVNPATGLTISEFAEHTESDLEHALAMAHAAYARGLSDSVSRRTDLLRELAVQLRRQKPELARLATDEMGKPIGQSDVEIEKCARLCEYYAEHGPEFLQPESCPTDALRSYVRFDPIGVILAVMPWNFPYWQVLRFAVPTLLAGNTAVLKHAGNVTGCALAIERIIREAAFPAGAFITLRVTSSRVADIIADSRIRAVTLTGSEAAGRAVAEAAGRNLKKSVLELGGSDPFIVLGDADIPAAAEAAATARMQNSGQSCIAAKRFLAEKSVADEFTEALTAAMSAMRCGMPLDENTQLGPLARHDLRDELHEQVSRSTDEGARLVCGGNVPDNPGAFYPATVLTDVSPGTTAFCEELFGPVAAVTSADSEDDLVALANDSRFGLGASVWTSDRSRGEAIAARIDSGAVFINAFTKSDPRVPFGGVKDSGFGRELSHYGIREFTNIKTVWVE